MVKQSEIKILQSGKRHTIYLKKELVHDSAFPFKPKQPLIIRIEGERLVIEKVNKISEEKYESMLKR